MKSEKKKASTKNYEFEQWAVENIYQFWVMRDEYVNFMEIDLYEDMYKTIKDKELRKHIKEGMELLYAERREIRSRKDHMQRQAGKGLLKWN